MPEVRAHHGNRPALGYGSKTAAIEAWTADGVPIGEIAERLGMSRSGAASMLNAARRRIGHRKILLSVERAGSLSDVAQIYDCSVSELIDRLLEVVVRDDLAEALLGEPRCGHG